MTEPANSTGGAHRPFVPAHAVGGFDWEWDETSAAYRPRDLTTDIIVATTPLGGWEALRETSGGVVPLNAKPSGAGFYGPDGAMHEAALCLRAEAE